jgi:DNA-binding GntR family transcriptional regulator
MTKLAIPRVEKRPVETQAADALRKSITSGAIPAGARITETQLAEQMDLSRASIRAALHQLAKEGLTSLIPYTGWTVVSLSPRDVWEIYTLRSSVERLAAQLVAKNINAAKCAALETAYDALAEECARGKSEKIAELDFALHKKIIELADHGRLADQYKLIEQQIRVYIHSSDALVAQATGVVEQHWPIVEAILAGDAEVAGRLSEQHNLTEGEKLATHLAQIEPNTRAPELRISRGAPRLRNQKIRKHLAE